MSDDANNNTRPSFGWSCRRPSFGRPRRFPRGVGIQLLMLWALWSLVASLWLVSVLIGDRFLWSQWVAWVPEPLFCVVLALLAATSLLMGVSKGPRLCFGTIAALAIGNLGISSYGWRAVAAGRPGATLVFINAQWPGTSDAGRILETLREIGYDCLVVTDAGPRLLPLLNELSSSSGKVLTQIGPFTVLSVHRLAEARLVWATRSTSVAAITLGLGESAGPARILLFDLPSSASIPRWSFAREMRQDLAGLDGLTPDLAIGDFNMTDSRALAELLPRMKDSFAIAGSGWRGTFPRWAPLWQLDHAMIGEDLTCLRSEVFWSEGSPHGGIIIQLANRSPTYRSAK